jgi:hypothetical protein
MKISSIIYIKDGKSSQDKGLLSTKSKKEGQECQDGIEDDNDLLQKIFRKTKYYVTKIV